MEENIPNEEKLLRAGELEERKKADNKIIGLLEEIAKNTRDKKIEK